MTEVAKLVDSAPTPSNDRRSRRSLQRKSALPQAGALQRGLAILCAFLPDGSTLSLAELCNRTGLPKSTTVRLLKDLEEAGFVERDQLGQYGIGLRAFEVGHAYSVERSIRQVAEPILTQLAATTSQASNLAVLDRGQVIHLVTCQPNRPFRLYTPLGYRDYAHYSGLGKVLLADLPETELNEVISRLGLPRRTEKTITDPVQFKAHLREVVAQGYGCDDEESAIGLRCVAVPVRNGSGRVAMAISVSGHASELEGDHLQQALAELRRAAEALSMGLAPYQFVGRAMLQTHATGPTFVGEMRR